MAISPAGSLIYSVTTTIDAAEANDLTSWMQQTHIPDVLATGCFTGAVLSIVRNADHQEHTSVNAQYVCASQSALDRYLADHAPRLRAHTAARYGNRILAVRTELDVQQSWTLE